MFTKHFFIAVLIGLSGNFNIFAEEEKPNTEYGRWETIECTGSPDARHENCFVESDGKFYVLGGRNIKPVNIFNPVTKTWTTGKKPPIEIHHFQGVSYKGKIYVVGAMTGRYPGETPLSHILIYDPTLDTWQQGDEIPEHRRRGSSGIVISNDKLYVVSGIVDGHNGTHVKWVDQYNLKTGEWIELPDAPRPRDHFSAVLYEGKIYCVGGRNSSNNTGQTFELTIAPMDVYDIKKKEWLPNKTSNNIPTERAGTSTVVLEDDLLVIGGESGTLSTAHDNVEAYNLKTGKWSSLSPLNRGRHGTQAIVYDKHVYIVAGSGNRGGKPELESLEMYTPYPSK